MLGPRDSKFANVFNGWGSTNVNKWGHRMPIQELVHQTKSRNWWGARCVIDNEDAHALP